MGSGGGGDPKSPLKTIIQCSLPNEQTTKVSIQPGTTVREALAKKMKQRLLVPETCNVFRVCHATGKEELISWDTDFGAWPTSSSSSSSAASTGGGGAGVSGAASSSSSSAATASSSSSSSSKSTVIPSEDGTGGGVDNAAAADYEIRVTLREDFPTTTSISHNFVRKTFFSLAFCNSCRKTLFSGFADGFH